MAVDINVLIALCNILDDYCDFDSKLGNLIKNCGDGNTNFRDVSLELYKISNKFIPITKPLKKNKAVKKFYENNSDIILKILESCDICLFIGYIYNYNGRIKNSKLDFFYNYIMDNRNNVDLIKSILCRLKGLGINKLTFDPNTDFTNLDYSFNVNFGGPLVYLDNLELIPNYNDDVVKYKTTGSNYKMILNAERGGVISKLNRQIVVNSLIFDFSILPDRLCKETIVDVLIDLKNANYDACNDLKKSVSLSSSVDNLFERFSSTCDDLESLNNLSSNREIKQILLSIKDNLEQLKLISSDCEDDVCTKYGWSKDLLDKEKLLLKK